MADFSTSRRSPLEGVADHTGGPVSITALPPATRFILRGRPAAIAAASPALGFALPQIACRAATAENRAALWLGPDEWLLLISEADGHALEAALAGLPHSLVDVSHRQSGLAIAGRQAATVLNAGCPLDLDADAFPVGMCARTLLGKSEIVLWRIGDEAFRVEAWRSFLPYVRQFLAEAARE